MASHAEDRKFVLRVFEIHMRNNIGTPKEIINLIPRWSHTGIIAQAYSERTSMFSSGMCIGIG